MVMEVFYAKLSNVYSEYIDLSSEAGPVGCRVSIVHVLSYNCYIGVALLLLLLQDNLGFQCE